MRSSSAPSLPVGRSSSPAVSTAPVVPTGSPVTSSFAVATYVPGRESGSVAPYRPAPTASRGTSWLNPSGPAMWTTRRRKVCALPSSPTTSRAHVELAARRVGLEANARIVRLAREVAAELPEQLRAVGPRRATSGPSDPCSRS